MAFLRSLCLLVPSIMQTSYKSIHGQCGLVALPARPLLRLRAAARPCFTRRIVGESAGSLHHALTIWAPLHDTFPCDN